MIYIYVDNNKQLFPSYCIMGAEISSNRDQADALDMYRDWNIKQATELLKKYKKNDYGKYIIFENLKTNILTFNVYTQNLV